MKKLTLTIAAVIGLSLGAYAQGYLYLTDANINQNLSTNGTSTTTANLFYGNLTFYLWAAPSNSTYTADASAINTLNQSGNSSGAVAALTTDGFTPELLPNNSFSTNQTVTANNNGLFNFGSIQIAGITTGNGLIVNGDTILALEFTTANGLAGVIAFPNWAGNGTTSATLAGWGNFINQAELLSPVPEPASLALAGLGGLSMLLFRRRK